MVASPVGRYASGGNLDFQDVNLSQNGMFEVIRHGLQWNYQPSKTALIMTSPSSSLPDSCSLFGSPSQIDSIVDDIPPEECSTYCSLCHEKFTSPKVLPCLHTFCKACLERVQDNCEKLKCPKCEHDCALPPQGVSGLLSDYAVINVLESDAIERPPLSCTGCKTKDTHAVARCFNCANYLCPNCVMAHQFMHCFEGHTVIDLKDESMNGVTAADKLLHCPRHDREILRFFCRTCNIPLCKECSLDHPTGLHDCEHISECGQRQIELLIERIEKSRNKINDFKIAGKSVDHLLSCLEMSYHKANAEIDETFKFFYSVVDDRKDELKKELEDLYNTKKVSLVLMSNKVQEMAENTIDLEFISNYQAIQNAVRNTFGYIRNNFEGTPAPKPLPIARPNSVVNSDFTYQNGHAYDSNIISKKFGSANSLGPFTTSLSDISPYEKWSNGPENMFQNGTAETFSTIDPTLDITPKYVPVSMYPVKSQIKRQKMIYHCKFGEFGVMEGQFTEPSGVAVNAQNDIIVADTNNHRIQIFDKEGRFKFQFGECGKRDGQLLYPNRVAVVKPSGDIIVTERSPTHQIQIYNQYGQFVRKFGANILQHPRGVTVDNKGRIIVAECKVMRVIIFDQMGTVLQKFGCSKHLEFPNGVVVNDKQEIFISDNRAHCVKVFNYDGVFIRQIGGEGLTNYPIGVCINQNGEILVADNHNNFNITIFTQDGQLVNASESKVKHAQCFDVALMDDGSVVLASKDYRLYIYRYVQVPGLALTM
ncbi:brain tumor protein [Trichonephila inaurata madagascariensis]|uniref:Brain tumor protein n=1 Tax=Trichonephila inaurata madagascariensis TaxID=2747483 RepID=A0A8X6WLM8_9ARAC|nr:brain tumor protein [Trichonephila inaurata madagascariensis]